MSTAKKLRGGGNSELTRLKALPSAARAEIFTWKDDPKVTNADLLKRIAERFGVRLKRDGQLSGFWSWQWRQAQWDRLGEIASQDEEMLSEMYPGVSRDRLRDATIKRMYAQADLEQDPKLGLRVVATDLKESREQRDWEKYQQGLKSKLQAGLDAVAEAFKGNARAMEFYQQARKMIAKETA
jgi:hypothetical protein